jgi:hypothetical protein
MDPKELRGLYEAYSEVYAPQENIEEGLRSAVQRLLGRKKQEPETKKPLSRGEVLRQRYNVGPEGSDTSAKRQILNRTRKRAEEDEEKYGSSPYSKSVAQKSRETHNRYLRAGYSKYGANEPVSGGEGGSGGRGGGHRAARKRAAALNREEFDIILSHLLDEGYAETQRAAEAIILSMSEDWRQSIVEAGENVGPEPKTVGGKERDPNKKPGSPKGKTYGERQSDMRSM